MANSTTNYANRQVDIEFLQTIRTPNGVVPVQLSFTLGASRIVTGIQKLVQRYTLLLLTRLGDVHFDTSQGSTLITDLMYNGLTRNAGSLQIAVAFANASVFSQMRLEDSRTDIYGDIPDDERLQSAAMTDFSVDFSTGTLYLTIQLISVAGNSYVYVLPTTLTRE